MLPFFAPTCRRLLPMLLALLPGLALAQTTPGSVGIGTATPDASAALDVRAADPANKPQGFLPPRLTYQQRTGISNAAAGLLVYQTNNNALPAAPAGYYYYTGTQWLPLLSQGDNLGNHTATQALNLHGNALTGTGTSLRGGAVGVGVRADGGLNLGQHTTGNNILLGYYSGNGLSTGRSNTFLGYFSGYRASTGHNGTLVGMQAGFGTTTGSDNTMVGASSGFYTTTGSENTFVGALAGYYAGAGRRNCFGGYSSGFFTTGSDNVFLGHLSGFYNSTGSSNVAVGTSAGPPASLRNLNNTTALGAYAQVTQSNSLVLGGTGPYAVNVGIGTTAPQARLDVNGNIRQENFNSPILSLGAGLNTSYVWTHNLGYQPVLLATLDQTGGGGGEYVIVSYEHLDNNQVRFWLRNTQGSGSASFRIRWIRVN